MSNQERIEARIESEFETKRFEPDPNGSRTISVTISSAGLHVDEVLDHNWVKDAYSETDGEFTVHVKAKSNINIVST